MRFHQAPAHTARDTSQSRFTPAPGRWPHDTPNRRGSAEATFDLALISALNHWFARNARDLPWRHIGTSRGQFR